jgi:hypothetical protein
MIATSVPDIQWLPTGPQLPLESNVLAGVLADMNTSFGGNMSQSLSSPQGSLAQAFTAIIGAKNSSLAYIAAQVDPDTASGQFQDAIGRIYFLQRFPGTGTVVTATCYGLSTTTIPAGSLAQDTAGNFYASTQAATIPSGAGSVQVQFQCTTNGPIVCGIGALSIIYGGVNGWESITNVAAGSPGALVESRQAFEARRSQSVAINSVNSIQAILAAVLNVPNVIDAFVTDNSTAATVNYGATAYPLVANSVVVSVAGGAAAALAQAIWSNKSLGCVYNGGTTFTYTDMSNPEGPPWPSYTVKWLTPAATPVYFTIHIATNSNLPSNLTTLVQAAVQATFNGTNGTNKARIGGAVNAGAYYAPIYAISPYINVTSLTVGITASPSTTAVTLGIDQLPTLSNTNIIVDVP